jgi:hypothetical protein
MLRATVKFYKMQVEFGRVRTIKQMAGNRHYTTSYPHPHASSLDVWVSVLAWLPLTMRRVRVRVSRCCRCTNAPGAVA